MSDYAGVSQMVSAPDVVAKYAGLETKVSGIDKTVSDLTLFVRNENSQMRRGMAEQNASLRHEMTQQNAGIINAIDKLSQTAGASTASIRTEVFAEISKLSEKQGVKPSLLISLGAVGLSVLVYLTNQNNKPIENDIAALKASVTQFVPVGEIKRLQTQVDKHESDIVSRAEHDREERAKEKFEDREAKLSDRIRQLSDKLGDRRDDRLDDQEKRLRAVEEKTAK